MTNFITRMQKAFDKGHGVRLGEASVVSPKVHGNDLERPGLIKVFTDLDAGQFYMNAEKENQFLHLDVFHQSGELELYFVAKKLWEKVREFLAVHREKDKVAKELSSEQWNRLTVNIAKRIYILTKGGEGYLYDLASHRIKPPKTAINSHVHFMLDLPKELYGLMIELAKETEKALLRHNLEIRKVEGLVHCQSHEAQRPVEQSSDPGLAIPLPDFLSRFFRKNKQVGNAISLANKMGSVRELKDLMQYLTPTKSVFLSKLAKKHNDLPEILQEMAEKNLVHKGKFFVTLTDEGKKLKELIMAREKDLASMLKKSIRTRPHYTHHTRRNTGLRAQRNITVNPRKVIVPPNESYMKNIALTETVINSVARRFIRNGRLRIEPEDIRVYGRKKNVPVDTCLVLDCSGSMVGEKLRAVRYLAENLLLSTRDRIAVVTFQNMEARVAVPFTNKYQQLQDGLYDIIPGGLTPMAAGIMKSIELIKKSRVKNPLLVLITDGIPNYPLWGFDGVADAIEAVGKLPGEKVRFLCIGIVPNKKFMTVLAQKGQGHLEIMEDLYRKDLVQVVHQARQEYKATAYN